MNLESLEVQESVRQAACGEPDQPFCEMSTDPPGK